MVDERGGDLDPLIRDDDARRRYLVRLNQRRQGDPPLVGDTGLDVEGVELEVETRHLRQGRRSVRAHVTPKPAGPGEQEKVPVVGIVIRVVMGDEDVGEVSEIDSGGDELPGNAIAAVNDVSAVVDEDDLGRRRTIGFRSRTAGGSEQDQPAPLLRSRRLARQKPYGAAQELPSCWKHPLPAHRGHYST